MRVKVLPTFSGMLPGRERGAEHLQAVTREEGGVVEGDARLAGGAEKVFHLAGGGEGDEHVSRLIADDSEGMGDAAGAEERLAGVDLDALVTDLEEHRAFEDVEVFLLGVVQMERRAAASAETGVLDEEEVAGGFAGQDFEGDGAEAEGVVLAEAVLAGGDDVGLGDGVVGQRSESGGREQLRLKKGEGDHGRSRCKKVTAVHVEPSFVRKRIARRGMAGV